ncbi:hypothetical protein BDF20DRAFT_824207 [Mycotypha africana]|uniref:uncharacterized protein n=1 Tax=Mycotypha africana TaxID=64632 RepID=UPI0023002EDE|nr:uncharacterized protein BDF20DRAFT_824207 [Mycotypha africana]KAI8973264.1 hypothetical protein BDF20DRAFT_824207 [Mycotypha africana]
MGAKRAVEGRSQPYDVLLAAYQKKSIGRPNAKERKGSTTQTDEPFIDSDEEVENVMQAIRLSKPTPLAQKPFHFVKRRRQCFRLRDILLDAITPKLEPTLMMGGSSNMNNHGGDGDKVNATESLTDIVTPQFTVQTQHRQPPPDFLYNHQNRLYNSTNNMVENNNVYINPP